MKTRLLPLSLFAALMACGAHAATPAGDGEVLATVMAVNDHEIAAANAALAKGVDGDVKDYAQLMTQEHGTNQEQSKSLGQTAGLAPSETDAVKKLKHTKKAERDAMAKLEGDAFEAAYVDAMVKDHAEVLDKLDKELIPAASNASLKAHLTATRQHVAMHLEKAKALDAKAK